MSDHRFEKQVGQKLDDLKITPSANSWEKIEREIRNDKQGRPAPIFWLPLLLLGLGAAGYLWFNNGNAKSKDTIIAASVKKTELKNKSYNSGEFEKSANPEQAGISDQAEPSGTTTKSGKLIPQRPDSRITLSPLVVTNHNEKTAGSADRQNQTNQGAPSSPGTMSKKENGDVPTGGNPSVHLQRSSAEVEPASLPAEKEGKKDEKLVAVEKIPEQTTQQKPQKKKIKKWSFGIGASGGVSSLSEGKLGLNNSQVALVPQNRRPVLSYAVSPAVVPMPANSPSKIYPGFSFSFGLTARYELSKRLSLSSSVNYLQMNTISRVGYKIEQATNITANPSMENTSQPLYLPPVYEQSRDYDNKYHFLEVPITLHTRINKSQKVPVYWNVGFAVSTLIKSNSLHYDAIEQLYYSNDKLLKKTQTTISTGFSFSVFNKTSRPLWFGPAVRYNISQVLKDEVPSGNKHFMGLGLDMKWFLK